MSDCNLEVGASLVSSPSSDPLISSPSGDALTSGVNYFIPAGATMTLRQVTNPAFFIDLPAPVLKDSYTLVRKQNRKITMSKKIYTYIKSESNEELRYEWVNLYRNKGEELKEFLQTTSGKLLEVTDHQQVQFNMIVDDDPWTLEFITRDYVNVGLTLKT